MGNNNNIKSNYLNAQQMKDKEMGGVFGGDNGCSCSCYWEGNTGSSVADNAMANDKLKTSSIHGCNQYIVVNGEIIEVCCMDEN